MGFRMLPCFAVGLTKPYGLFFALKQYVVHYGLFPAPSDLNSESRLKSEA